jgi:hypothetical protein
MTKTHMKFSICKKDWYQNNPFTRVSGQLHEIVEVRYATAYGAFWPHAMHDNFFPVEYFKK